MKRKASVILFSSTEGMCAVTGRITIGTEQTPRSWEALYLPLNRERALRLLLRYGVSSFVGVPTRKQGLLLPCRFKMSAVCVWCHSHMELSRSAIVGIYVKLINTKAEALLWYATRERKTEISEVVGCTVDHVRTFAHHISLHLAD